MEWSCNCCGRGLCVDAHILYCQDSRMVHPSPQGAQAMSEKKRHWFQIHLSTAIGLMFVAGGILGLNFTEHVEYSNGFRSAFHYGWPRVAYRGPCDIVVNEEYFFSFAAILLNISVLFTVLLA